MLFDELINLESVKENGKFFLEEVNAIEPASLEGAKRITDLLIKEHILFGLLTVYQPTVNSELIEKTILEAIRNAYYKEMFKK